MSKDQIDLEALREGMLRFGEAITQNAQVAMAAVGAALSGTKAPEPRHDYLSTACWHEANGGGPELHGNCRASCKTCNASCVCPNHPEADSQPVPTSWVDQARDVAIQLLDQLQRVEPGQPSNPELAERIRTDPALFWLRGEVQPPGEWKPDAGIDR